MVVRGWGGGAGAISSVQSPDRLRHRGDMRNDSAEMLFQSFLQKALVSSSGIGQGCPLFDVVHPALSPTLEGTLKDGFRDSPAACDMHAIFRLLRVARRGSFGPTRKLILLRTQSLVVCSLEYKEDYTSA